MAPLAVLAERCCTFEGGIPVTGAGLKPRLRAIAYIDGFNFYYRTLKDGPHKWLNLQKLLEIVFPEHDFVSIKYFTANVTDHRQIDPSGTTTSNRQQLYLRALQSTPTVQVIHGKFLTKPKYMAVHPPPTSGPAPKIKVVNTEEKGSDVNLATELLLDAAKNNFDIAIVISIDSDLERPIRKVGDEFGKPVHLAMGRNHKPGSELRSASGGRFRAISDQALELAQFPLTVILSDGSKVTCPSSWEVGYVPPERELPANQVVRAVVRTVKGKFEQGEVEIDLDPLWRLVPQPGQQIIVRRLPIAPTALAEVVPETSPKNESPPDLSVPLIKPKRRRRRRKKSARKVSGDVNG